MTVDRSAMLVELQDTDQVLANPADDVRGLLVRDRNDREVGVIDGLLLDPGERRVRFLRVEPGGAPGAVAAPSYLPVEIVVRIDVAVHLNRSVLQVADAPIAASRLGDRREYFRDLYGHYGCLPFWAPGYVYPKLRRTGRRHGRGTRG